MNTLKHTDIKRPKFTDMHPEVVPPVEFDIVEPKADGRWVTCVVENTILTPWSRHGKISKASMKVSSTFPDGIYLGEHIFGTNWAKKSGLDGTISLFDALEVDGEDLRNEPLYKRKEALGLIRTKFGNDNLILTPSYDATMYRYYWKTMVEGRPRGLVSWEGLIFKQRSDKYGENWGRMKKVVTMDYICTGRNPGGGRYTGVAASSISGGLYINGKLTKVASISGISDELRYDIWKHPEKYIGRVFEAEGKELFDTGALRHPNFLRWREDKDKSECKWPK